MKNSELIPHSAVSLAEMIRTRKVSPLEVTRAMLTQIERLNPVLNAFTTIDAEESLRVAARAERSVMLARPLGPLHGVPLHVKENLPVAGSRTTFGSKLWERNVAAEDCVAVERLRQAGMILIGRTNMPEFGWKGVTDNRVFGITRNPWNTKLTPGGSSGGASAAVAAGLGPIGLGTDGGGSLRIPASFTGVFGFKPSFGRVPDWPGSYSTTLRHIGVITRTVADTASALEVLAGPDPRDLLSAPAPSVRYTIELNRGIRGKRVAYSPDLGYARVEPEVAAICQRAAERFVDTGAHVEQVRLELHDPYKAWRVLFFGATAAALKKDLPTRGHLLDPGLRRVAEESANLREIDFTHAQGAQNNLREYLRHGYKGFDLLLCPTVAVPPFAIGQDEADPLEDERLGPLQWSRFTYPFNLTGQPAASVPAGWTKSGLPVGLQIIGDCNADMLVLQAARAWEEAQPWRDRGPSC